MKLWLVALFLSLTFGIGEHTKHCSMSFLYSSTRNDMLQCFVCSPIPKVSEIRGNRSEFHSERNYYLQNWYFRQFLALGACYQSWKLNSLSHYVRLNRFFFLVKLAGVTSCSLQFDGFFFCSNDFSNVDCKVSPILKTSRAQLVLIS